MARLSLAMAFFLLAGLLEARAQGPGSFRIDPQTGQPTTGKLDFSHADAAEVLHLVLTDWMTNPKVKGDAYGYLIDLDAEPNKKSKLVLERLLIDERYLPKKFTPTIPGIRTELFDRSRQDLKPGEMCIRLDRFEPKTDGTIEVEFLHSGYGIIGGAWVTYRAQLVKGKWTVAYQGSFDP